MNQVVAQSEKRPVEEALEPLYEYLEQNLAVTFNQLERVNFYRFSQRIWSVIIDELRGLAWQHRGSKQGFFQRLDEASDKIGTYMHAAGNGLSIQHVKSEEFEVSSAVWRDPNSDLRVLEKALNSAINHRFCFGIQ